MEAFIEIDPDNMDFAMSDDWAQLQDAGEAFANTELDAKLKLHATTRSFPVEQITETIEDRLHDEDVTANPVFKELLEEYRETRPKEMRERGPSRFATTSASRSPRWRCMTASAMRRRPPRSLPSSP